MRLRFEQSFPGRVEEVMAALTDPGFLAELATLPKMGEPKVLESTKEGGRLRQRVRYRFTGDLPPVVTRVLDPAKLVWVDDTTYDLPGALATFRIVPDHYANRLRCSGTYRFSAVGERTRRLTEGELKVSYPFVGGVVERAIASGIEDHLEAEAELLGSWLADRSP